MRPTASASRRRTWLASLLARTRIRRRGASKSGRSGMGMAELLGPPALNQTRVAWGKPQGVMVTKPWISDVRPISLRW